MDSSLMNVIEKCIKQSKWQHNPGLTVGDAGMFLLLSNIEIVKDKNKAQKDALLDDMINNNIGNYSVSAGFSGILLALALSNELSIIGNSMDDICNVISRECRVCMLKNDFDYFRGASGMLYCLLHLNYKNLDSIAQSYIINYDDAISHNKLSMLYNDERGETHTCLNLGTPHGIVGHLLVLIKLYEAGFHDSLATIKKTVIYLLSFKNSDSEKNDFPSIITENQDKIQSNIAWCYGDLMTWYAFLKAGKIIQDHRLVELSLQKLRDTIYRQDTRQANLCLCHGMSGLYLIYNKLYELTNENVFYLHAESLKDNLYSIMSDFFKKDMPKESTYIDYFQRTSLFNGFPGSFLIFISEWDKRILEEILIL